MKILKSKRQLVKSVGVVMFLALAISVVSLAGNVEQASAWSLFGGSSVKTASSSGFGSLLGGLLASIFNVVKSVLAIVTNLVYGITRLG